VERAHHWSANQAAARSRHSGRTRREGGPVHRHDPESRPPNTVSTEPSHLFLAENLLHEAVHQSVSFHVLQHQVFADGYSSKTSPKIEIAWRATQGVARNQCWEVDRAFHATCVYNQLLRFRRRELDRDDLTTNERASFQAAYDEGMPAVRYLMGQLELLDEHFTVHGRELLADLRRQTNQL
jgi:hypothetical protein